ncbi:unnamed protein product [Acanthoscelides obtectus]|uniref:Integrase zinc-binding domain-containing protein n=1 Tax=Acanthoscelides obtectus TaxID=200917 RepID=A0A9P0KR05_ACAOB|nr:unnamed protein product [Acanthoscelides obtectus]CAK1678345.1 KRAB-A domain-containing protein 2 [Acanthoscelides obtectus]
MEVIERMKQSILNQLKEYHHEHEHCGNLNDKKIECKQLIVRLQRMDFSNYRTNRSNTSDYQSDPERSHSELDEAQLQVTNHLLDETYGINQLNKPLHLTDTVASHSGLHAVQLEETNHATFETNPTTSKIECQINTEINHTQNIEQTYGLICSVEELERLGYTCYQVGTAENATNIIFPPKATLNQPNPQENQNEVLLHIPSPERSPIPEDNSSSFQIVDLQGNGNLKTTENNMNFSVNSEHFARSSIYYTNDELESFLGLETTFLENVKASMQAKISCPKLLTKARYTEIINRVKKAKMKTTLSANDRRLLKNYDIITIEEEERLIVPICILEARIVLYVYIEEMFKILVDYHLKHGHIGKNGMITELGKQYKNFTHEVVALFLDLCQFCKAVRIPLNTSNNDEWWVNTSLVHVGEPIPTPLTDDRLNASRAQARKVALTPLTDDRPELVAVEELKEMQQQFNSAIKRIADSLTNSFYFITESMYCKILQNIKNIKEKSNRTHEESRLARKFGISTVSGREKLTAAHEVLPILNIEELFAAIHKVHITNKHIPKNVMVQLLSKMYANIAITAIEEYIQLCAVCKTTLSGGLRIDYFESNETVMDLYMMDKSPNCSLTFLQMHSLFNLRLEELVDLSKCDVLTKRAYSILLGEVKKAHRTASKDQHDLELLSMYDVKQCRNKNTSWLATRVRESADSPCKVKYYIYLEQAFRIIHDCHILTGHGNADIMEAELSKKIQNINSDMIALYLELCGSCMNKTASYIRFPNGYTSDSVDNATSQYSSADSNEITYSDKTYLDEKEKVLQNALIEISSDSSSDMEGEIANQTDETCVSNKIIGVQDTLNDECELRINEEFGLDHQNSPSEYKETTSEAGQQDKNDVPDDVNMEFETERVTNTEKNGMGSDSNSKIIPKNLNVLNREDKKYIANKNISRYCNSEVELTETSGRAGVPDETDLPNEVRMEFEIEKTSVTEKNEINIDNVCKLEAKTEGLLRIDEDVSNGEDKRQVNEISFITENLSPSLHPDVKYTETASEVGQQDEIYLPNDMDMKFEIEGLGVTGKNDIIVADVSKLETRPKNMLIIGKDVSNREAADSGSGRTNDIIRPSYHSSLQYTETVSKAGEQAENGIPNDVVMTLQEGNVTKIFDINIDNVSMSETKLSHLQTTYMDISNSERVEEERQTNETIIIAQIGLGYQSEDEKINETDTQVFYSENSTRNQIEANSNNSRENVSCNEGFPVDKENIEKTLVVKLNRCRRITDTIIAKYASPHNDESTMVYDKGSQDIVIRADDISKLQQSIKRRRIGNVETYTGNHHEKISLVEKIVKENGSLGGSVGQINGFRLMHSLQKEDNSLTKSADSNKTTVNECETNEVPAADNNRNQVNEINNKEVMSFSEVLTSTLDQPLDILCKNEMLFEAGEEEREFAIKEDCDIAETLIDKNTENTPSKFRIDHLSNTMNCMNGQSVEASTQTTEHYMDSELHKPEDESVFEPKSRFMERLQETKSGFVISKKAYYYLIGQIKKAKLSSNSIIDKHRVRSYDIMKTENSERLVTHKEEGSTLFKMYAYSEEIFDIIHNTHIDSNHSGVLRMKETLKSKYQNITGDMIRMYLETCDVCRKKMDMELRCQVDIIDMQNNQVNGYSYILVYHHHTKLVQLRPLKSKQVSEVAGAVLDIFAILGVPNILHISGTRHFAHYLIRKICKQWRQIKVILGKQRLKQTNTMKIEKIISRWIIQHPKEEWTNMLRYIQVEINTNPTSLNSHQATFGTPFTFGLKNSSISLDHVTTEKELEIALYGGDCGSDILSSEDSSEETSDEDDGPLSDNESVDSSDNGLVILNQTATKNGKKSDK